tara:strand:- start:300 stop:719 length:420 start_codon:yes stop_codon:yes gene_type:complete
MSAEKYFNLYKKCVDIESIQFSLEDFKRFHKSINVKIEKEQNCIAILGLTDSEVEIYFIGVVESLRGRGLGKKLLKKIISFSKNYGADLMILEVGINNIPAKNMYLSLNFKEYGIRKNYYRNSSGIREDAIIMKLKLKT